MLMLYNGTVGQQKSEHGLGANVKQKKKDTKLKKKICYFTEKEKRDI